MPTLILAAAMQCLVIDQSGANFSIVVMEEQAATLPWRFPEGVLLCPTPAPTPPRPCRPPPKEDIVLGEEKGAAR